MEHIKNLFATRPPKTDLCLTVGALSGIITSIFGGWTTGMQTLVILMVIDYVTGLLVAGLFKNSAKTENGGLKSDVGFKGLAKKFVALMIVAAMYRIDLLLGIEYLKDLCVIGFVANEFISVIENAGLMGIPLPSAVTKAIEVLNQKAGKDDGSDKETDSK